MKKFIVCAILCVAALGVWSCGSSSSTPTTGAGTGDKAAKNGSRQILAVNRIKTTPQVPMPGTVITRGVILENIGGTWKEILRCDEHLENPKGFLGNIPLAPVNGWRLQFEQDNDKGLLLYFTPATDPKGARMLPVEVRWNIKAKRYQSLDRNFENFLYELPALETPESQVRL